MDIGESLRKAIAKLSNTTIIDLKTIKEFNKELQKILLSGDVDVKVVFDLTSRIEREALKSDLPPGVSSRDYILNIVYNELVSLVGESYEPEIKPKRILLIGLYGSGKTTTSAKIAKYYQNKNLGSGVICCDVSRPAAYEQLETLSKAAGVGFYGEKGQKNLKKIVANGLEKLRDKKIIICDTSGRNALDANLIEELKAVNSSFMPDETILVISADIGHVVERQAAEFNRAVKVTGLIITKMDGSSKGGGALSAAHGIGAKVMFIGTGEKLNNIEAFDSKKYVGGLLGIPNIGALLENIQNAIKEANIDITEIEAEKLNFETFYTQLKAMNKMGPLKSVFGMMGAADMPKDIVEKGEEKLKKYSIIISSMTKQERVNDKLVHNPSRIARIARGSGTTEKDVRELLADFNKMKKMMNMFKNDRSIKKRFASFMSH
ncbi:signal recognition particle receptor subunit alpha [Candidatus Marsarchaeota archaeon]|nr:signal recognition particle receptor subunit alpha [Candidatus Marsarchaeota archaeon]